MTLLVAGNAPLMASSRRVDRLNRALDKPRLTVRFPIQPVADLISSRLWKDAVQSPFAQTYT